MTVKTHAGEITAEKNVLVRIANAFYSEAMYYERKGLTNCANDSGALGSEIAGALKEAGYLD